VTKRITLAITGASGAPYALRLIELLLMQDVSLYLLLSDAAKEVFRLESGLIIPEQDKQVEKFFIDFLFSSANKPLGSLYYFNQKDWLSPVASGSNAADAMVICPCSMGSLSAIANGASNNLIERAADVMIKEKKPLLLVPREMPLSSIHLKNMLTLSELGINILPASPGFYQQPKHISDMVDFVVARILDHLALKHELLKPWGEA